MNSKTTLQIVILGVGGIGSGFAFKLSSTGHHRVTVVARPNSKRFEQLNRDKEIITTTGERADVRVADSLDEQTPYDLVIVTVPAHQVAPLIPSLQRSATKRILLAFNNFNPEELRDELGVDRVIFGMPLIEGSVDSDTGKLLLTIPSSRRTLLGDKELVEIFSIAGLPAQYEPNMPLWLRCHVPIGMALESVCYAAEQRNAGATWSECMTQAYGIHETFRLIQRLGYDIYPSSAAWINRLPAWVTALLYFGVTRIASFRKLLAAGMPEARALNDAILEATPRVNPPVRKELIQAMRLGN